MCLLSTQYKSLLVMPRKRHLIGVLHRLVGSMVEWFGVLFLWQLVIGRLSIQLSTRSCCCVLGFVNKKEYLKPETQWKHFLTFKQKDASLTERYLHVMLFRNTLWQFLRIVVKLLTSSGRQAANQTTKEKNRKLHIIHLKRR